MSSSKSAVGTTKFCQLKIVQNTLFKFVENLNFFDFSKIDFRKFFIGLDASKAIAVACGSYHSVILLDNGQVLTFGNYQKGQLGRDAPQDDVGGASALNTREELAIRKLWFAYPDVIPDIGSDRGRDFNFCFNRFRIFA